MPDPQTLGVFYVVNFEYEIEEPIVRLIEVDCEERRVFEYGLDAPDSAPIARGPFGRPVVAPNGRAYGFLAKVDDPPTSWMSAFCETDWSAKRKIINAARRHG